MTESKLNTTREERIQFLSAPSKFTQAMDAAGIYSYKAYAEKLAADAIILEDELARVREERDRLEVQLAGCGAAALGWNAEQAQAGDYGWSASYADVLKLREEVESLRRVVEAVRQWEMYQDIEYSEALVESLLKHTTHFGGRDD